MTDRNIQWAKHQAHIRNEVMAVVTLDECDERIERVIPLRDTTYDEFEAFDGQIELIAYPDGCIEF